VSARPSRQRVGCFTILGALVVGQIGSQIGGGEKGPPPWRRASRLEPVPDTQTAVRLPCALGGC
jgi:hypothetical protein